MYLKPQNSNYTGLHFCMVVLDSLLSMGFIFGIIFHIIYNEFKTLNDKVIECIIGIGLSMIVLIYSFFDGIRFLDSTLDKVLYLVSCILQKPILIPMMLPSRFRSPEATQRFSEQRIVKINGRFPGTFVLTVQETNFFYSFTLSFVIALVTVCD